jgi:hypothetical protein
MTTSIYNIDGDSMTRESALTIIWRHTHRDFRGTSEGVKTILVGGTGGTSLVALDALTDEQLMDKLTSSMRLENRARIERARQLTPMSLQLFLDLARDADNWSGTPLFGGNVGGSKESRGNLTHLKRAGLVKTQVDEDDRKCSWVYFTAAGKAFAAEHGITLR